MYNRLHQSQNQNLHDQYPLNSLRDLCDQQLFQYQHIKIFYHIVLFYIHHKTHSHLNQDCYQKYTLQHQRQLELWYLWMLDRQNMMQNLFDDSEKRIIDALDRGMDDFCNGRIKFSSFDGYLMFRK